MTGDNPLLFSNNPKCSFRGPNPKTDLHTPSPFDNPVATLGGEPRQKNSEYPNGTRTRDLQVAIQPFSHWAILAPLVEGSGIPYLRLPLFEHWKDFHRKTIFSVVNLRESFVFIFLRHSVQSSKMVLSINQKYNYTPQMSSKKWLSPNKLYWRYLRIFNR